MTSMPTAANMLLRAALTVGVPHPNIHRISIRVVKQLSQHARSSDIIAQRLGRLTRYLIWKRRPEIGKYYSEHLLFWPTLTMQDGLWPVNDLYHLDRLAEFPPNTFNSSVDHLRRRSANVNRLAHLDTIL